MQFIAQDWLVLRLSGDSGTALGVVTALQFTPVLLLSLYGGKLADRYDKRRLLIAVNIIWGVLALLLGLLVVTGAVRLWHVFVFAALFGSVSAIENPMRQAFASELVGTELLPNALSLNSATFNVARIVGPAVAGVLISWLDTGPVILLNAASYLAVVTGLFMIEPARLHRSSNRPRDTRIINGIAYVLRRPDLLLPMALILVIGGLGFNFQITLALFAKTEFNQGAATFGLLSSALAVGALCGALASSVRRGRPSVYVLIGGGLLFGVMELVVSAAPTFVVAAILLVAAGFTMIYFAQAANQRVQLGTDEAYRGRVMALYILVFLGSNPLFAPLVGWLGEQYGARIAMLVGGVASVLASLLALLVRSRRRGVTFRVHMRPRLHLHVVEPHVGELRIPAVPSRVAR